LTKIVLFVIEKLLSESIASEDGSVLNVSFARGHISCNCSMLILIDVSGTVSCFSSVFSGFFPSVLSSFNKSLKDFVAVEYDGELSVCCDD
jgi:hypothetical protein